MQRYLVDRQDDDMFLKIDIAASLLQADSNSMKQEEKEILATVKKINVVAFKLTDDNEAQYDEKMEELKNIINQDQYKTLMKFGSKKKGATLKYFGEEDAIDEIIVFASDDEKGFALFRLLGENMRPDQMIQLLNSIENGDLDASKLSSIGQLFDM